LFFTGILGNLFIYFILKKNGHYNFETFWKKVLEIMIIYINPAVFFAFAVGFN